MVVPLRISSDPCGYSRLRAIHLTPDPTLENSMHVFHDGEPIEPCMHCMTKAEMEGAFLDPSMLRREDRRTRTSLILAISQCPPPVQDAIRDSARRKAERMRTGISATNNPSEIPTTSAIDYPYMEPPSAETIKASERHFLLRTGSAGVKTGTCCSCARRTLTTDLSHYRLANIPNQHLLTPTHPHPAHVLFDGVLLHRPAVNDDNTGWMCSECVRYLKRNKRPPLSLANHIFLGDVPFELRLLSLAEKILIPKYYPAAYVIKLYPRDPRARSWDHRLFTNGLKGNVASYPLSPEDIAEYVAPSILPPSAHILSSTICVTFVGPNGKPERFFPDTVYVRRGRVRDALLWLKDNNPLYQDITISEENLSMLPENGVPDDIRYGARISNDETLLGEEQDNYVLEHLEPALFALLGVEDLPDSDDEEDHGPRAPLVVPLQPSSAVDATGSHLTERHVTATALANTARTSEQLNVHRGTAFVNEYPRVDPESGVRTMGTARDANHLLGTFPWLFPYGVGGFEVDRPVDVTYERHAKWALMYDDGRFRQDYYFSAMVFGVIRKRQVARAASIEMSRTDYSRNLNLIAQLTPEDFAVASAEEERSESFLNPAMRALHQSMSTAAGKVVYTDASIKQVRSVVWGTVTECGPPTIWFTLNPSDLHNPVAQVFVGQDIDLDAFDSTIGPSSTERAINVAQDPAGAALFCHHLFRAVLECLFGIVGAKGVSPPTRRPGVLGTVQAYVGTIEAQGRGTLHMHCLLWLSNTPLPSSFDELLSQELFRERVVRYIGTIMHADINGMGTDEILNMPTTSNISYLITHGPETKDATFYMSDYQSKGSQTSYNTSALLSERIQYHVREEQDSLDIAASAKRLLTKCLNSLNRLQEFGGPQITSAILDLPDRYISHHHVPIYLDGMRSALKHQFSDLNFWVSTQSLNKVVFIDNKVELRDQLHEYHSRKCRVVRKPGHETHPNFIGRWFPRNDRMEEAEEHAAMMLMLFRPWRELIELRPPFSTFSAQYLSFIESAPDTIRRYIDNIQYYHQGMDRRTARRSDAVVTLSHEQRSRQGREDAQESQEPQARTVTPATLELARRSRRNAQLINFGNRAISIAKQHGIFSAVTSVDLAALVPRASITQDVLIRLRSWAIELENITFEPAPESDSFAAGTPATLSSGLSPSMAANLPSTSLNPHVEVVQLPHHEPSSRPTLAGLRKDQRLVHDIVERQLLKHINKEPTEQLLMLCLGEGGTGKTKIIKEITETYREHSHGHWLSRTATSGVAATLIDGETLHSWLGLGAVLPTGNQWMDKAPRHTQEKRKRKILNRQLLIIDECSMLTSRLLCLTAQLTDYVRRRGRSETEANPLPFGGLDVIMFGDLHQFPPVARAGKALYEPSTKEQELLGHQLYQQFTTVVILQEQMRLQDPRWLAFLKRLRVGACTADDMRLLRQLTLTNPECIEPDYTSGREPTIEEQEIIILGISKDFALEEEVEIAVGARVMIEMNIATEAGLANGTRGTIMDIVLDENEGHPMIGEDGTCRLKYPPALVWVKPDNHCSHVFDASRPGQVPLMPNIQRFSISVGGQVSVSGKRLQLPLSLAYAFTDYKSQGQTLDAVLVDLAAPPDKGNGLTSLSAYVALSRVKDSRLLRILREFNESFLGRYPADGHPFNWKVDYPMDFVVEANSHDRPAMLTILGCVKSAYGRLGPLGDFMDKCESLAKSQYTLVVQSPHTFPLGQAWSDSIKVLYNLHDKMRTGTTSWTLNLPGAESASESLPFYLHAPVGPFTPAHMNFTRPVFTTSTSGSGSFGVFPASLAIDIASSPLDDARNTEVQGLIQCGMRWTDVDVKKADGSLIQSWDYPTVLDGSTVAVDFELGHSCVFGKDDFVALLKRVTVEIPGPGMSDNGSDSDMPGLLSDGGDDE
ncbi:hypothetical protein NP233_g7249 [Leucocoprinus birnbaumii]|uniref:ATP-dependent DNA helicase n=1 Tax=Leucocoprinus birnbaumii TaxID=56174 RepID=A0AAD5YUX5_9AGAR|nr:hypothetical protein NP233_g7249 [Leucocoprinus birnbaumii]